MSYTYTPSEGAEVEEGALATRFVWQHTENVRKRSVTSLTPPWLGVDEYFVTKCIYTYISSIARQSTRCAPLPRGC